MKTTIILLALISLMARDVNPPNNSASVVFIPTTKDNQIKDTDKPEHLLVRPFRLEIAPPSSGVQFYRDGIIFLSHSKIEEKVPAGHISFGALKIYSTSIIDSVPGDCIPFNIEGSVVFPSEATTFSSDYNTMYVSLIPAKSNSEKIFKAEFTPSGWKISDEPINICIDNSIYSHPCLSADGTFMIFSSDMTGSTGGLDLFITRKEGDAWSNPKNLGKSINSSGNELFASLDSRNNLYFSSDGHPGEGGYDIFISTFSGEEWGTPQNLTDAINSRDDELAFTICREDNRTAFYTTRTRTGRSRTQLNLVTCPEEAFNISQRCLAMAQVSELKSSAKQVQTTQSPQAKQELASVTSNEKVTQARQVKQESGTQPATREVATRAPEIKKEATTSDKNFAATPAPESKKETPSLNKSAQANMVPEAKKDEVVYRVQILANTKPIGSQNIVVAGNNYKSFEYLYKGGYRTTIGEYSTLAEAVRLQNSCRQSGYNQAFVVAFKNNVRSTDPSLFK
jgi:hypothetical protein